METLLVRAGESLPHKQALSVISGCPPGARAAEQGPSHVWHRGLAKATRCQARRQGDVGLNERLCNVTCGVAVPGHRLQQAKGPHGAAHPVSAASHHHPRPAGLRQGNCHRPGQVAAAHKGYTKPFSSCVRCCMALLVLFYVIFYI